MEKNDFLTIKADSMEKALQIARTKFNESPDNLEIKVLTREKQGFLFAKEAVVIQARQKEPGLEQLVGELLSDPQNSKLEAEPEDGWIEICEGKIIVANPTRGGKYPTIEPASGLRLSVNGEIVTEQTIVTAEDDIRMEVLDSQPSIEMAMEISEDKQKAWLTVTKHFAKVLKIRDFSPCLNAVIFTETVRTIFPPKISPREVMKLLGEKGVVFGINDSAISSALENDVEGEQKVLIASGLYPEPGKNATIEYTYKNKTGSNQSVLNPYRENVVLSVEAGEVLAVKCKPQPGHPGVNLFNETVEPEQPQDIDLQTGDGVKLVKDGTVAVAAISGRPKLDGDVLMVLPVFTVNGDVDINVGNISFKGDIEVLGSVLDGFELTAAGDLIIHGNIIQSRLTAGGDITIYKNVISSEVLAGGASFIYKQVLPLLKRVISLISDLLRAMQMLRAHSSFKVSDLQQSEGRLIQLLIDTKFKMLPKAIGELFDIIKDTKTFVPTEIQELVEQLHKFTGLNPLRFEKGQEVFDILKILEDKTTMMQEHSEMLRQSNITMAYVQNSVIRSSGDIIVSGRGAITSDLTAGGSIISNTSVSVVRGGKLCSGNRTCVKELGSNASVTCTVIINEGSVLEAELVHPAVLVESTFGKYRFEHLSKHVKAYISSKGTLEVENLRA